jgi:hypothetical protein
MVPCGLVRVVPCIALVSFRVPARIIVIGGLLAGLVGCSGGRAPVASPVAPPAASERISVIAFDGPTSVVSYEERTEGLGREFAAEIVDHLRRANYTANVVEADDVPADGLVVRGRLLRVNGGSRALRFWVGLGAGRASVSAEGTVSRADGPAIAAFRDRRSTSGEAELGLAKDRGLVDKCLRVLAQDVAKMITSGKYREQPLGE